VTSSRGALVVGALVVFVVAVTTAMFVVSTKDDGAPTAEAAATAMMDAVQRGDLVAVFEQLPPGERRALQDGTVDLGEQLQRLGLVTSFDPSHLEGLRPSFEDVRSITTEISKDTTAVDLVNGRLTIPFAASGTPPLTPRGREVLERLGVEVDLAATEYTQDFEKDPLRLMAIREGGGWHVSLAYSVAEAMRTAYEVDMPEMGHGPPGRGGSTPGDAVGDLVRGYADGDPVQVLAMMNPDEARSLYDYAPAFLPEASYRALAADANHTYDVQLNKIETDTIGGGPVREVKVTALDLDIRDEVHKTHVTYDGRCLHADLRIKDDDEPYAKSDTCNGEWKPDDASARIRNNPVANLAIFGGGADLPTFTVVERQGRWYVSPARTLLASMVDTLATVPPDKVEVFADRLAASWRAGAGDGISGQPAESALDSEELDVEERRALKQEALVDACRALVEGDQAEAVTRACVEHLVETKRLDPANIPDDL
jgi:hypothetical protein